MKKVKFLLWFCMQAILLQAQDYGPKKLIITFNNNIELLGLAYFIGFEGVDIENKSVNIRGEQVPKKDWHKYGFYIYQKYKQHASSEH